MSGVERARHYKRQVQPTCGKTACCGPDFGRIFIYATPYDTCPCVRTSHPHHSGVQAHFSWFLLRGLHLFRGINGGKKHSVHCRYMPILVDEMTRINKSLVYMQNHATLEAPGPRPLVSSDTFSCTLGCGTWMDLPHADASTEPHHAIRTSQLQRTILRFAKLLNVCMWTARFGRRQSCNAHR